VAVAGILLLAYQVLRAHQPLLVMVETVVAAVAVEVGQPLVVSVALVVTAQY
jgi:hypothetical protein